MPKFSSLLEGLVSSGWVVEDNGVENALVVFVVAGIVGVGIVFVGAAEGRSLIQTVLETKWYPCGHFLQAAVVVL